MAVVVEAVVDLVVEMNRVRAQEDLVVFPSVEVMDQVALEVDLLVDQVDLHGAVAHLVEVVGLPVDLRQVPLEGLLVALLRAHKDRRSQYG